MQPDLFDFANERAAGAAPVPAAAWEEPDSTLWGRAWLAHVRRLCQSKYASELTFGEKLLAGGRLQGLRVRRAHIQGAFSNRAGGMVLVNVEVKTLRPERWRELDRLCERCGDTLFASDEQPDEVLDGLFSGPEALLPGWKDFAFACSHCRSPFCVYRAATLLAVAAELDLKPIKLFELRGAPRELLLMRAAQQTQETDETIDDNDLSALFGIEFEALPLDRRPDLHEPKADAILPPDK